MVQSFGMVLNRTFISIWPQLNLHVLNTFIFFGMDPLSILRVRVTLSPTQTIFDQDKSLFANLLLRLRQLLDNKIKDKNTALSSKMRSIQLFGLSVFVVCTHHSFGRHYRCLTGIDLVDSTQLGSYSGNLKFPFCVIGKSQMCLQSSTTIVWLNLASQCQFLT